MPIASLQFSDVGPFSNIELDFDPHVNVFTGPNNSGKSTILLVLAELLVYPFNMPHKLLRSDGASWKLHWTALGHDEHTKGSLPSNFTTLEPLLEVIGHTYFVPAQRSSTEFRSSGPTVGQNLDSRLDEEVAALLKARPLLRETLGLDLLRSKSRELRKIESPMLEKRRKLLLTDVSLVSDGPVIQKIVDLDYAAYREDRPEKRLLIDTVAAVASDITESYPVAFAGVREDATGLIPEFDTPDGLLPLNVLSQGTQSLLQWLCRLLFSYGEFYDFPSDLSDKPGVLIIDEIDAHLHPSWQRRIIPTLVHHFPSLQIFCSTHSPLMLTGLGRNQVQLLRRTDEGCITVSTNESEISGWTADEILRNYFAVSGPTDWHTAANVERLQELSLIGDRSDSEEEEFQRLRTSVGELLKTRDYSGTPDGESLGQRSRETPGQ